MNQFLSEETAKDYSAAGNYYGASAFSQVLSAGIDWQAAKVEGIFAKSQALAAETQATQIKTQAVEQANALREQYMSSVGNVLYTASLGDTKVTSGSVVSNIESSAKNLGTDIATITKNAETAAKAKKVESDYYKTKSKLSGKLALAAGLQGLSSAGMSYAMAQKNWNKSTAITDKLEREKLKGLSAYSIEGL